GGRYSEVTWRMPVGSPQLTEAFGGLERSFLPSEWNEAVGRLDQILGTEAVERFHGDSLRFNVTAKGRQLPQPPLYKLSRLQEDNESFFALAVVAKGEDSLKIATVRWPKTTFDEWWRAERSKYSAEVKLPAESYPSFLVEGTSCTND